MRTRVLFWILFPLITFATGAWWYMGYVNSTHPAPWPMAGGDAGHRSYTAASLPKSPKLLWKLPLNSNRYFDPVIGEDGTIYIAHEDGLTAVSPGGEKLWAWTGTRAVFSSAALGRQGHIYLRDFEALYAFNSEGQTVWKTPLPSGGMGTPLLVGQGGVIYTYASSELYAVSADGKVKWHVRAARGGGPIETANGLILILANDRVVAYDRSGEVAWETTLSSRDYRLLAANTSGKILVSGERSFAMLDQKGTILLENNDGFIDSRAMAVGKAEAQAGPVRRDSSGAKRWSFNDQNYRYIYSAVLDRSGSLLLQASRNSGAGDSSWVLVSVDPTGKLRWVFDEAYLFSRPAVSKEGRIVFYGHFMTEGMLALVSIGDS